MFKGTHIEINIGWFSHLPIFLIPTIEVNPELRVVSFVFLKFTFDINW